MPQFIASEIQINGIIKKNPTTKQIMPAKQPVVALSNPWSLMPLFLTSLLSQAVIQDLPNPEDGLLRQLPLPG
jgi:hypothetical protein